MMANVEKEGVKTQIPEQLDRLDRELSGLEDVVKLLRDRLQPAMRTPADPESKSTPKETESLVDLANCIKDSKGRVAGAAIDIAVMLELLELQLLARDRIIRNN